MHGIDRENSRFERVSIARGEKERATASAENLETPLVGFPPRIPGKKYGTGGIYKFPQLLLFSYFILSPYFYINTLASA